MELHLGGKLPAVDESGRHWSRLMTRYHWFVLMVAALGWVFDCLDQQLFNLARKPAMVELSGLAARNPEIEKLGGYATSIFLIGWASGGIFFGILGDRIGRAKTMMWTILLYSLFTGLSALSQNVWDFSLYRFLTGLGVGGEFAVGVALVAETMPDRARPYALGLLQALSTIGNVSAAGISLWLGQLEESGVLGNFTILGTKVTAWRVMFMVGTLPALLAILIRMRLREPERWRAVAIEGQQHHQQLGSIRELFGDPRWRRRAIVGMLLASSGVIGLWGIGFFSIDFNRTVFRKFYEQEAREAHDAVRDQQFVSLAIRDPTQLHKLSDLVMPNDLLGLDDGAAQSDPKAVYGAALELQKDDKPVSVETIMERLDGGDAAKKIRPQTAEERTRRLAYLNVTATSGSGGDTSTSAGRALDDAQHIATRTKQINGNLTVWAGVTSLMFNFGAFFGIWAFSRFAARYGRKPTFAVGFVAAMLSTAAVFWFLNAATITIGEHRLFIDVFWMIPLMGFCQLSLFGGYAIYFPELFPTRLRSTGTSFCYNVGRFVAALGPAALGLLTSEVYHDKAEPFRWAGVTMCAVFLLGLAVLPFAATKGQPLPE